MNCPNCNAWVPDDSAFCPECGQKVESPAPVINQTFCSNCGAAVAPGSGFCENCGAQIEAAPAAGGSIVDKIKQALSKLPANTVKLGAGAIALILVIAIVASLFSGSSVHNYALYVQDGEVQYASMPGAKDAFELTSDFSDDLSDYYLANYGSYLSSYFQMSSDGKKLFYPDKVGDGYTLYYRDVTNTKKEPVKIESNMDDYYSINEKGTLVTYIKDGKLYQHDLSEKTKIASDVDFFVASSDGKTLLYATYEDSVYTLYQKKNNKDAEKLVSNVTEFHSISEDMTTVVYSKDDSLYIMTVGKDPEKISSNVDDVIWAYDSGEVYYTKAGDDDSYCDELYFYNGKEGVKVTDCLLYWSSSATDSPAVVFAALEDADAEDYDSDEILYCVAVEDSIAELDLEDVYYVTITNDASTIYARADYDSDDEIVTLYKITLNGAKIKSSDKLDEDVYAYRMSVLYGEKEAHVIYFKDVDYEDSEGELYMDGTKIDDDAYLYNISYNAEEDTLYYLTDMSSGLGTLKYSNGKKSTSVKDDVYSYIFTPGGECLFLYDYSTDSFQGELWIQNGNSIKKLADDVTCIIPVY